ncbi:MAG: two-component regulator propeller domain-containing protein [Bacteroidota bacterium]
MALKLTRYLIPILLLVAAKGMGQPKCKIEHYSTAQGLSHQRVTTILKDREGFMWFGSWDGINRFDGHSFISYKSSPGNISQLGSYRIDQIVEDETNHLWVQSYDRQVYRFDKRNSAFTQLSITVDKTRQDKVTFGKILAAGNGSVWLQSTNDGLFCVPQNDPSGSRFTRYAEGLAGDFQMPSNAINFLHEDREHHIWIGTPAGLCRLSPSSSGSFKNTGVVPSPIATGMNIVSFDEDNDRLYFGTNEGSLVTYTKKSASFNIKKIGSTRVNAIIRSGKRDVIYATTGAGDLVTLNLVTQDIVSTSYRPAEPLGNMYEDTQGLLWIEPEKSGVIRFNPLNGSFLHLVQQNGEGPNSPGNRFRVLEDHNNVVWVSMKGGGFGYYNPETEAMDYFLNTPDASKYPLPSLTITTYYDNDGILWLTTYDRKLIKIILLKNDFRHEVVVEKELSVSDNEIRIIAYDNKNRLWAGTKSGQLFVYKDDKKISGIFDNEPPQGLGLVYAMLQDRQGNIWLGTKGNGLFKATPVSGDEEKYHLTHFTRDKNDPNSLPVNEIYTLLEDMHGRIWIGSFDNGLVLLANDRDSVKFIHTGNAFKNYPKNGFHKIRNMKGDRDGRIWIGTTDGLMVLDADDRRSPVYIYKTYSKNPGDPQSLGNNDIQFVYRDSKNRLWLATSGGGFSLATAGKSPGDLRFRNYTIKDGMPNDYVLSCAEDRQGNLWLATENGLSKFNPDNSQFRNYDSYDGLPKASFSEAAVSQRPVDGQLVFGTTNGYLSFNPNGITNNRITGNIAWTNLQINNKDAGPGMDSSGLQTNINYLSDLTLKYDQNIISIDYAILDHRAGSTQNFAYRLLGFDSAWHDDRQLRRATYTNLPHGKYVFEVKSLNTDLYANTPSRRLSITILPPPWKTWWAYALYLLFACVLLIIIRRYTLKMIGLRNRIVVEQKLAALKMDFFTNISHELRTPLTLIVGPLDQLLRKEKLSPAGTSYVDVAHKNATRMVRFVNQLLDLRKVQSNKAVLNISPVELVAFVTKVRDHFSEAANAKNIELKVVAAQKDINAWVDPDKLEVVIYNLLSNAIKFTPEGKSVIVKIETVDKGQHLLITVSDQGPGVTEDKLEHIFELFYGGDGALNGGAKGTGIGLSLSREFVDLHGGKIWAANNEAGGLTVSIMLKLDPAPAQVLQNTNIDTPPETTAVQAETYMQQTLVPLPEPVSDDGRQLPLVLLVEDNDELRTFIKAQLSEFYRVETAADGEEGFEKTISLLPELVVSDIMMPKMDGIQMLDKIKNDVNTSHIPVVLLTAKYSIESQIKGLMYGADYYITKPFNIDFLVASINNLLKQRKKLFESLLAKKPDIPKTEPALITTKDEMFLKDVIAIVEDRMTDTDFNIETIAESMAMSRTTFYKKFKSLTGSTIVEFVRDIRLQQAKERLETGEHNISEVAYMTGFSSPNYFSTCFKEKYQVSPSDFIKSLRGG